MFFVYQSKFVMRGKMLAHVEVADMRTLRAVVESEGITNAAHALKLSQSAVSHKIKRLEVSLGKVLLNRAKGGGALTDDGRRLYDYACRMLCLHDEAVSALVSEDLVGEIKLGITEDMITSGLVNLMGRFARKYPDVQLKTIVEQSRTIDTMLAGGELDIGVVQMFATDVQRTDVILKKDTLVWVGPRDHDLSKHAYLPFIAFDRNCFYRHWLETRAPDPGRPLRVAMECASVAGVIEAVRAGLGYALVSKSRIPDSVVEVKIGIEPPTQVVHVARSQVPVLGKPARMLMKELETAFSTQL